jgi:hypothetical protein
VFGIQNRKIPMNSLLLKITCCTKGTINQTRKSWGPTSFTFTSVLCWVSSPKILRKKDKKWINSEKKEMGNKLTTYLSHLKVTLLPLTVLDLTIAI